jgi:hypothetical protein
MKKLLILLLFLFTFLGQAWALQPLAVSGSNYTTTLDGASVTISPQTSSPPVISSSKWDGEYYLNLQLSVPVRATPPISTAMRTPAFTAMAFNSDSKQAQFSDTNGVVHSLYIKPDPNGISPDGVFENEITFSEQPESNLLVFTVDCSPQITWNYQPPTCPTGSYISQNVAGSYALYIDKINRYLDKTGKEIVNYQNGKYAHIYAFTLTDANNNVSYAPLTYDPDAQTLTATMDANWLANTAVFPVIVDPTIGYSSTPVAGLVSLRWTYANIGAALQYTAVTGDRVTQFSFYGNCQNLCPLTCGMGVYTFSGGLPANLLAAETTLTVSGATPAWTNSSVVSQALTNGVVYVCAVGDASDFALQIGYDFLSNGADMNTTGGALGNPWSNDWGLLPYALGMYATVTAGAVTSGDSLWFGQP